MLNCLDWSTITKARFALSRAIPPSISGRRFSGGGYIFWGHPGQEFYVHPPRRTTPTPRRVFSRVGVGIYKIWPCIKQSEKGWTRSRARSQTPNTVSFSALAEFRGESSASSSQPIICAPKRTHEFFRRSHRACRRTHRALSIPKQYSRNGIPVVFPTNSRRGLW